MNTDMEKAIGSATSQNNAGSGPARHQAAEEALSHQARETTTIISTSPRTSSMSFYPSRIKDMSKPSCPNSTSMPRETSRTGEWAQILPKLSECIRKAINSTPTTAKDRNSTSTPQVVPQEHRIRHHEDPPKDIFSHPQITLAH